MNYALCMSLLIGIFLFMRIFNIRSWFGSHKTQIRKSSSCMWCGIPCCFKGKKHINFSLPLLYPSYFIPSLFIHMFGMFVIPLFINNFTALLTTVFIIITLIPAYIHKIPNSEAGTIWCFISIFQFIIIILISLFNKKEVSKDEKGNKLKNYENKHLITE